MSKLNCEIICRCRKEGLLKRIIILVMILSIMLSGTCMGFSTSRGLNVNRIEAYHGIPFVLLNNNIPEFEKRDLVTRTYQKFSPLDRLGRTGMGIACLGTETIPTETRGQIGNVRPSGWHTVRYDDLIEDRYLYNRCHVIGYQLGGDNATPENLFTGTRYLNGIIKGGQKALKASEMGDAERSISEKKSSTIEIAAEMECIGHDPVEPKLVYFQKDDSIKNLIRLRMSDNTVKHQKFTLSCSQSSGIRENDAAKIDAALASMKYSLKASVTAKAQNEARRCFEYEIDF